MSKAFSRAEVVKQLQSALDPTKRLNPRISSQHLDLMPRFRCEDGFSVSIQASSGHYCTPRDNFGPWDTVELGFPSRRVPDLISYRDGSNPDTKNVFGYVPIEKVADLIIEHGGIRAREAK